jgi:uncharacterized integral membrane protein
MIFNVNKFNDHIRKDPESWPVVVITLGTAVYGGLLIISKYFEVGESSSRR